MAATSFHTVEGNGQESLYVQSFNIANAGREKSVLCMGKEKKSRIGFH